MKEEKQKIFTPREFLANYQLPQLVCIHEAHLQQVNESRPRQVNRTRLQKENSSLNDLIINDKQESNKSSLLSSLTNTVQQLPKQCLKKAIISNKKSDQNLTDSSSASNKVNFQLKQQTDPIERATNKKYSKSDEDEIGEEVFSDELIGDCEEDYHLNRFNINTLASSDSGNASAASSNCSENQYSSNSSTECTKSPVKPLNDKSNNLEKNSNNLIKTVNQQVKSSNKNKQSNSQTDKKLLDLDQPFLLYKSYSSRQVIAHILDVNLTTQQSTSLDHFQRTGPALLIPETYSGI